MTTMTDQDAARLVDVQRCVAEWRAQMPRMPNEPEERSEFLLRLLDAAARPHDASFVIRPFHAACVSELMEQRAAVEQESDTWIRRYDDAEGRCKLLLERAEAAEAACARHVTAYDEVARRVAELERALEDIGRKALHWQAVFAANESLVHKWRDIQMRAQGASSSAKSQPEAAKEAAHGYGASGLVAPEDM